MNYFLIINYCVIPIVTLIFIPIIRTYVNKVDTRLNMLEHDVKERMSENQIRMLLTDKLEPLTEGMDDMKGKIDWIIDYLLKQDKK